jgi:FkbM family methyltransferase
MTRELPPPTIYGETILWERPIQIVASDWVSSGGTVYDVGGNTGGLAIAFSRIVGPNGRVFSFECNPFMIAWARQDIEANNASGVEVIPYACYSESGKVLELSCDDSFFAAASSLYRQNAGQMVQVTTKCLDDFAKECGLNPDFIKIDVEEAEADVLKGAEGIISAQKPVITIEYTSHPDGPENTLRILRAYGYDLFDVNDYQEIDDATIGEYCKTPIPTNVIAVPQSAAKRYRRVKIDINVERRDEKTRALELPAGRFVLSSQLSYSGAGMGFLAIKDTDGTIVALYCAPGEHLKHHSCSCIVVDLVAPQALTIEVGCNVAPIEITLDGVDVWQVTLE